MVRVLTILSYSIYNIVALIKICPMFDSSLFY